MVLPDWIKQYKEPHTDFVSFSDGKIPNTWQTTAWTIDNTIGYDDIYSLKSTKSGDDLITNKTCNTNINFIEFYVRNGSVNFFVDGVNMKTCSSDNNWTKYGFFLKEGWHTIKWESVSSSVNIDAIRFKKSNVTGSVGDNYQGGIIAYLDNTNEHGIIAAPNDQSEGVQWYNGTYIYIGATGMGIGDGKSNTVKIVQVQGVGNYAAKICDDLVLNGYDDWYLPSRGELNILYQNRNLIGGFNTVSGIYWSSSEGGSNGNYAWCQDFFRSGQGNYGKNYACRVRAVRAF